VKTCRHGCAMMLSDYRDAAGPHQAAQRRQALMVAIKAEPGLGLKELGRRVGLGNGVLNHHLRALVRQGLAWCDDRAAKHAYHAGAKPTRPGDVLRARVAALDARDRRLYDACLRRARCQQELVAEHADASRSMTQARLRRLHGLGLLQRSTVGRRLVYEAVRP